MVRGHATAFLLTQEDAERYKALAEEWMEELQPRGPMEKIVAEHIVNTQWRLNRITSIAHNLRILSGLGREGDSTGAIDKADKEKTRLSKMLIRYHKEFARARSEDRKRRISEAFRGPGQSPLVH